jgi:hypothetical protein
MIPPLAFKIAARLIEEQLLPQAAEPADISPELQADPAAVQAQQQPGGSVLSLLGKQNATATEPAPKVVTDTGTLAK